MNDNNHYNDGLVDIRYIDEFALAVITNIDGNTQVIAYDTNWFTPLDIVQGYKNLWPGDWGEEEEKEEHIQKVKDWLIENGCTKEELEEEE